jgi:hypothetical protein
VPLAPGPAAGILVATHFVYSMALKRKRAFASFGWDLGDGRNRSACGARSTCFDGPAKAMLFGHTFFDQTDAFKSVLCALPGDDGPSRTCCAGLASMADGRAARDGRFRFETTGGRAISSPDHFRMLEGCNDYQLVWD